MHIFPCIYIKTLLILFIVYRVPVESSNHHFSAPVEVIHDVLKFWLECFFVNCVEIDVLFCSDLYSLVLLMINVLDVADKASHLDEIILDPLGNLFHFVPNLLEEHHSVAAGSHQDFAVDHLHLAEIHFGDPLESKVFQALWLDAESLPLAIKRVDAVLQMVKETTLGEVL